MTPTDFGLSVIASWLANKLGNTAEEKKDIEQPNQLIPQLINLPLREQEVKVFEVYDVFRDLENILRYVQNPCAHIIVETKPSTFYHLAALVIEDKDTGIWFVFNRGRMSFQGTGGGAQQADRAVSILKKANIPVAPWAVSQEVLDDLERGYKLWPSIKNHLVPLISSCLDETKWPWIQMQAKEVIYNELQQI